MYQHKPYVPKKHPRYTFDELQKLRPGVEFRKIPISDGYYAGTDGSIWSRWKYRGGNRADKSGPEHVISDTYRQLTPTKVAGRWKYPMIWFFVVDGPKRIFTLHSVIALTFIGPRPDGMQVCHWDGDRTNCRLSNLRYGTPKENQRDKERHGTTQIGERNGCAIVTADQVLEIRRLAKTGMFQKDIGARFGITQSAVHLIVAKKNWAHV